MRRSRSDAIRVGLFVVATGILLVGGLLWIAGSHLLRPVVTDHVLFEQSVSGLNAGADVQFNGVVVGRVRDIRLTADIPPNVVADIDLDPGTPIRTDTVAVLVGSLVTGIQFIELKGGTSAAGPLPAGGTIRGTVPSLEKLQNHLTDIADRIDASLVWLQQRVFTEENAAKLGSFVGDLAAVAGSLDQTVQEFRAERTGATLTALARRLSKTAGSADRVLTDFYSRRARLYGGAETALRDADASAREIGALARRTDAQVRRTAGALDGLIADLSATASRLRETLDVIRSDPSVLLHGRSVPQREYGE